MRDKDQYSFIKKKELLNVSDYKNDKNYFYELVYFFLKHIREEIIYVQSNKSIIGIVTLGDLYRYFNGEKPFFINTKYTCLNNYNIQKANLIFHKFPKTHEIPIVNSKNELLGVIKINHKISQYQIEERRKSLYFLRDFLSYKETYINCISKIKSNFPNIKILIYQNPYNVSKYIDKKEREELQQLQQLCKSPSYNIAQHAKLKNWSTSYEAIKYTQYNGFIIPQDMHCSEFNIINGRRITPNAQTHEKKVFLLGPCTVLGAFTNDSQTISFYLQELINKQKYPYEVINLGIINRYACLNRIFQVPLSNEDIIIFVNSIYPHNYGEIYPQYYKGNLTEIFCEVQNPLSHILNEGSHCDAYVNSKIANKIWGDLKPLLTNSRRDKNPRKKLQNYFIEPSIFSYYETYKEKYNLSIIYNKTIGAIVMNCNPFTLGHLYLIEQSALRVDLLYIFVVEEDQSYFKFKDRFHMVKVGTKHLNNIRVLPSGKYVISKETFDQYFDKDNVTNVNDMSYDLRIFSEVVAKGLNITKRFIGEEPNDFVTKEYNEKMKKILPDYGIEVIEYKRLKDKSHNTVISASAVRSNLSNDVNSLNNLCPKSTIDYLVKIGCFKNQK